MSPPSQVQPDAALEALLRQAGAAFQAGRLEEALDTCKKILARQPDRADVLAFAGTVALKLGDTDQAAELYQSAVTRRPDFAEAHYNHGNALKELGRLDEAAASYRRARDLRPDLPPVHHNLGSVLHGLGQYDEAVESYRRTLELVPDHADTHRNLGLSLEKLDRAEEAAAAFRRAIEIQPTWVEAYHNLASALLNLGDAQGCLDACDRWLALEPGNIEALSVKGFALNELGLAKDLDTLFDFERLVQVRHWQAPEGYADLAAFNKALVDHVLAHPTLRVPDPDHPTYHHTHLQITEELLAEPKGPIADLEKMMRQAVEDYRRDVGHDSKHPFLANFPERWRLTSWAAVLNGEGNLLPHIHLEGHLSGCYYAQIPDVIGASDSGEAGYFELGRPPEELHCLAEPRVRAYRPEPGLMLLFPSYFYHCTVPFRSDTWRISIAFDMVPEDG